MLCNLMSSPGRYVTLRPGNTASPTSATLVNTGPMTIFASLRAMLRRYNKRRRYIKRAVSVAKSRAASLYAPAGADKPFALGVMGIMKNEGLNIIEWLDHYFMAGAGRIYLIDNGSTDRTVEVAKSHPRIADIRIMELPEPHRQVEHYRTAISALRVLTDCEWLLIADLDEFWFSKQRLSLTAELAARDDLDLIYGRWTNFAASREDGHPASLRRELLLRRPELDQTINTKWICRTSAIASLKQVHIHKVFEVESARTIALDEIFQINHYQTQSRHYFQTVKMSRGDVLTNKADQVRDWTYFEQRNAGCDVKDTLLRDLLEAAERKTESAKAA
jgi:hypothetical protein